jgi:hypothetical protein
MPLSSDEISSATFCDFFSWIVLILFALMNIWSVIDINRKTRQEVP